MREKPTIQLGEERWGTIYDDGAWTRPRGDSRKTTQNAGFTNKLREDQRVRGVGAPDLATWGHDKNRYSTQYMESQKSV